MRFPDKHSWSVRSIPVSDKIIVAGYSHYQDQVIRYKVRTYSLFET